MTAPRTPRTPKFRYGPALPSRPWEHDNDPARYHYPRHRLDRDTPAAVRVAAIRERCGR